MLFRSKIGQHSSTTRKLVSGVPQGLVLGLMLFTIYVSPVGDLIISMGLKHHQYADDTQLYFAVRASHYKDDLNIIEKCTSSVQDWFLVNDLLLNPTKSEVIAVGTATQRRTIISAGTVTVAGAPLLFVDNIRSLGVQIDSNLSFDAQVKAVCRSCNHHIRALRQIRNNLSPSSVHVLTTVTRSFTTSQRRTFKSYTGYKTMCTVESTEIDVARINAGLIAMVTCRLPDTV